MCKHVAAALYGVGARLDEDPSLFFTLRGIAIDDIITQTVADTTQKLLRKAERQSANVLEDVDLGDIFGIQLDNLQTPRPDLPTVQPKPSTRTKNTAHTQKTRAGKTSTSVGKTIVAQRLSTPQHKAVTPATAARPVAAPPKSQGTMLEALLKALGKTRKGKPIEQLQDRLGWTKIQLRNTLSRAGAKGFVEMVTPGVYRQKI